VWAVAQTNVANATDEGYEDVPADAQRRNELGEHECSMTEQKEWLGVRERESE
jgi:hypothetical protein